MRYRIVSQLGKGSFGQVFLVEDLDNGQQYALKRVPKINQQLPREFMILESLKKLKHQVYLRKFFLTRDHSGNLIQNFLLNFYDKNLEELLNEGISVEQALDYSFQLFKGLQELQEKKIIHRDIKPENCMIDKDGILKICDFNCSKSTKESDKHYPNVFSRYYRAPELCLGMIQYDYKTDVWAAGCVMMELLTGSPIFAGKYEGKQLIEIVRRIKFSHPTKKYYQSKIKGITVILNMLVKIKQSKKNIFIKIAQKTGKYRHFMDLIKKIFNLRNDQRITAQEVIEHEFFEDQRIKYDNKYC